MDHRRIIYPTPWKPTLIKSVPRDYAIFSVVIIAIITGIAGNIFVMFPAALIAWIYGALKAKEDPEFFTVYAVRFFKLKATKGSYKGREYTP
ncbi:VirB3 family type IV secretion system protein [Desulfospira joergensenii]|uniref:VirB3 family type IV secretion system protein n=1 Tax=Desulfospira joergensenii TaxID=53329 RepID=UPI0003B7B04F|nr:VirB3 family type IV secretion system protein [Desulfospira joergensenii]